MHIIPEYCNNCNVSDDKIDVVLVLVLEYSWITTSPSKTGRSPIVKNKRKENKTGQKKNNPSRKSMVQQYYYTNSNSLLPPPLFNTKFGKPPFLGKRFGATDNIELEGGVG